MEASTGDVFHFLQVAEATDGSKLNHQDMDRRLSYAPEWWFYRSGQPFWGSPTIFGPPPTPKWKPIPPLTNIKVQFYSKVIISTAMNSNKEPLGKWLVDIIPPMMSHDPPHKAPYQLLYEVPEKSLLL